MTDDFDLNYYKGKRILVTGGVGSIGSVLVKQLTRLQPAQIKVYDNNETGLFDLENELCDPNIKIVFGDIRDKERIFLELEGVDVVFHASALKHVPMCEYNAFEAVKTNVIGTQNILEAAISRKVKKFINVSTDKAVNPVNVMGATKFLSEKLTISANYCTNEQKSAFSSVRFGNVLFSRGSVIPTFLSQIKNGNEITVTDDSMTRFFMDIPSAVQLILKAGILACGKEIFILKMKALNIYDLATVMIDFFSPKFGLNPDSKKIKIIGRRLGEKLHEELMTEEESYRAYQKDDLMIIFPYDYKNSDVELNHLSCVYQKLPIQSYSSERVVLLSKAQIFEMISNYE